MTVPVNSKMELIERLQRVRQTLRAMGVSSLGLFGSFARDQQTSSSDVDLLIEFESGRHSFDNFMEVSFFLEDLLGRRVQVVTMGALSPYIGPHILKEVENVLVAA